MCGGWPNKNLEYNLTAQVIQDNWFVEVYSYLIEIKGNQEALYSNQIK